MSATYNWAYRPGITNKYGFTVPPGADNVQSTGWCYVALFGNDNTGNGSRQLPYRTITKAISLGNNISIVLGSGVYRETAVISTSPMNINFIGDGDVIVDVSFNGSLFSSGLQAVNLYNLTIIGNGSGFFTSSYFIDNSTVIDVICKGAFICSANSNVNLLQCIVSNFSGPLVFGTNSDKGYSCSNSTFYNCNNIQILTNTNTSTSYPVSCVFYNCNISATDLTKMALIKYSLFFQCNFKMTNTTGSGGVLYPSVPSGYTYYSTISALQAAYYTLFSTLSFSGCIAADPLFNNESIGDYSLSFSSPAKNLSYFGTYVGAKSIAYAVKASATESLGSFDFSTNVNLNIANDSITLVDSTQNASIQTNLIVNTAGRQIQKFPIYGFNADRNGQYIDSIPDLAILINNPGDTLNVIASYLVGTGAITYNGSVYQPGDRFTTVTGVTTFTSSAGGTLTEILEAPERHTIMARFGNGDGAVTAGTELVVGYWYYVQSGNVTYDSVVYNAGSGFKAIDTNAFTGTGSVILALSTEAFQHYEPSIQPTSNNVGNSATGAIIRGNGDPAYVRGGYGIQEFPINATFIQLYYLINVSNLKP